MRDQRCLFQYLDDVVEVLDCLQQILALLVPPAFFCEPGFEVEPLLPLVVEHGVQLPGQGGDHAVLLSIRSIFLRQPGIEAAYLVEEVKDDFLKFGLAHRVKEKKKCWMLSPAGIPCEVYFTRSRSY